MLTLIALIMLAGGGYAVATCVFGIDEFNLNELLILTLMVLGSLYRLVDRWPVSRSKYRKSGGARTSRHAIVGHDYEQAKGIKVYARREWDQLLDYFNIWRMAHEWKRDRLARSLASVVHFDDESSTEAMRQSKEAGAAIERKKLGRDVYDTAESILRAGQHLQYVEGTERVVRKECPVCKSTGWENNQRCSRCGENWNRTVPRFRKTKDRDPTLPEIDMGLIDPEVENKDDS